MVRAPTSAEATQAQVDNNAIQACYAATGLPCALIASGNAFAIGSAELPTSFTYKLTKPASVTASTIPFVYPTNASSLASAYNAATAPKALAISPTGSYYWVGSSASSPLTIAQARKLALERCELSSAYSPCTIFAENATVTFNPAVIGRTPAINYALKTLGTHIPAVRPEAIPSILDFHKQRLAQGWLGAVAIHPNGAYATYYASTQAVANSSALSSCQSYASSTSPCLIYATGNTLPPLGTRIHPYTYNKNLHCKAVPRNSCTSHKGMGCTAPGQYYIVTSGVVSLETCL
jgi:hypothetical protein